MTGIIDTIKLAGTLVLALPAAFAGVDFLLRGRTGVGIALIGLAIGLIALERYVTLPTDIPGLFVKRVFGTVVKDPDPDAESNPNEDRD